MDVDLQRENGRYGGAKEASANPESSSGNQKNSQLFKTQQQNKSQLGSQGISNSRNGSRPSRGTRVLHYNEDDAFNQSYVERVLRNSQQQYPNQHGQSTLDAATPSASRSMDLREAAEDSRTEVNVNSRLDRVLAARQTPASHLRQQSVDFFREFDQRADLHRGSRQFVASTLEPGVAEALAKHTGYQGDTLGKASRIMGQFLVSKQDSATVTGRLTQERNRRLRNSFQPGKDLRLRSNLCDAAAKYAPAQASEQPGAVGPRTRINVPRQLILHQLSKNMDMLPDGKYRHGLKQMRLSALGQASLPGSHLRSISQTHDSVANVHGHDSGLDFLEAPTANTRTFLDMHGAGTQHTTMSNYNVHARFGNSSTQGMAPHQRSGQETTQRDTAAHLQLDHIANKFHQISTNNSVALPRLARSPSNISYVSNFHITDLLERSIMSGAQEKAQANLRQVIEFYKRSVKGDKDLHQPKEIMISNYRLRVANEADDRARQLFTLNKGTSIYVSNSILKPEIHKYSTKISDKMSKVYPFLLDEAGVQQRGNHAKQYQQTKSSHERMTAGRYPFIGSDGSEVHDQHSHTEDIMPDSAGGGQPDFDIASMEDLDEGKALRESMIEQANGQSDQSQGQFSLQQLDEEPRLMTPEGNGLENVDDLLSQRPFTASEAAGHEAIAATNRIFDRWLRNLISAGSQPCLEGPARLTLKNGEKAPLRIADINWQIAIAHKDMIKEKPIPLELLTEQSFHEEGAYRHLQMLAVNHGIREGYCRFVLKTSLVKTYSQIAKQELQSMDHTDCKIAIDFARAHLTHVDPVLFRNDKIPLELFIDYEDWIKPLYLQVREAKRDNERDRHNLGIEARTDYDFGDGVRKSIDVRVNDFNPNTQRFLVENAEHKVSTWRSRLFVRLERDERKSAEAEYQRLLEWRKESLHHLRIHRLINDQLLKRYSYLKLPNDVLLKIQKRIYIDLLAYDADSVRKLILQIEALFVFAILKATLRSQKQDPYIKGLYIQYKVPEYCEALSYFQPERKEKAQLKELAMYNMKSIKVELDKNSILLMDEKYIKIPIFLNSLTEQTIGTQKLFNWPFDVDVLHGQNCIEFKRIKKEDLNRLVNHFPLHHDHFVAAQKGMSLFFHQAAKFRWVESISRKIRSYVQDDFDFTGCENLTEDQIDPCLLRLFYQLKQYMQTVIFEHFELAVRSYTQFLLSFMLRDFEIKETKIVEEVTHNPWVRLGLSAEILAPAGRQNIINDIELIPLKLKPMIKIYTLIEDIAIPNKILKRQKILTNPKLETVHKDLFSVILDMHNSLQGIDRIDGIVFPLLQLRSPNLLVPDVQHNERLSHYVRVIEKLIDQSLKSTKKELSAMSSFMGIFDKKVENLILDLKKRSFQLQQEISMAEAEAEAAAEAKADTDQNTDDGEEEASQDEKELKTNTASIAAAKKLTGAAAPKPAKPEPGADRDIADRKLTEDDEEESFGAVSDDDQALDDEGYQGNDMAYKSVEIDDGLMRVELLELRAAIWRIQENVFNQYDFGLVYLDCTKFKKRILTHCQDLINHLESHIRADFTQKQKAIQSEIVAVTGKLDMDVESIDDVIMLLDYIESLKNQDNKIGDIVVMIDELARRMTYIESVEIIFPGTQYFDFLHIRNWPRTFRAYIENRKVDLLSKKDSLYQEMSVEIADIFGKISMFKATIQEVLGKGLVTADPAKEEALFARAGLESPVSGSSQREGQPGETAGNANEKRKSSASKKQRGEGGGSVGVTFYWLAKEIGADDRRFQTSLIDSVFCKIEYLKQQFDEVERATSLINKRESLLGVKNTQFTELKVIQDDLKPLYELWLVASKFGQTFPEWVEGKFEKLDAGFIEMKTEEWQNELKRLQKTSLVIDYPRQQELQKFMIDALNHFKRYGPMLRTLRTKGLAPRHWKMVAQRLNLAIDPGHVTMYRLIRLGLYDDDKLKTIKQVCEVATKEYAVQQALEGLDKEMRSAEFEFEFTQDASMTIVNKLPELIIMFEEYSLRIGVLKTNPNVKNLIDRLLEIERIIKNVLELLHEWAEFQRSFVYLHGIFVLEEIQSVLPEETRLFLQVQGLYDLTSQSFKQAPQVHKINARENFQSLLVRSNQECETIRQGLRQFLEQKRGKFPRLFFLSNEELIDIFGRGAGLVDSMVSGESKGFMSNLFEGVDIVRFDQLSQEVTHMVSKDGEEVQLVRKVPTKGASVDAWLGDFERTMVLTGKENFFKAFEHQGKQDFEEWIRSWPGQATYLASQVWFCMKLRSIFEGHVERVRALRLQGRAHQRDLNDDNDSIIGEEDDSGTLSESNDDGMLAGLPGRHNAASPPLLDELDLEDEDEERAYTEEVHRQIAKDEIAFPERAQLEKVLRLKQRFRVNKNRSPGKQMEAMQREITATILKFTGMVRQKLRRNVRQATVALLTCYVHFRDILNGFIKEQVQSQEEFQWQIQFKFDPKGLVEVVHESALAWRKNEQIKQQQRTKQRSVPTQPSSVGSMVSEAAKESPHWNQPPRFDTHRLEVAFEVFGHVRSYGFEYLGNCPRLVVTPLTERCQRSLLVALQYHYGGAPEGPFGTGKTETTKDLSRQVAKLCFVTNCSATYEYSGVCRFFKGLASSGAWVCFDEFNRMETRVLSMLSQVMISLQTAIKSHAQHVLLDEARIALRSDCAVFITLNPGYAGRSELPMNLKALFRPISMVIPDSMLITEILLYSAGFVGAQQLAKKIVSVQSLADTLMRTTLISHDFGLRSIKAIVSNAESIKLQAQNILDSELTDIIDDASLHSVQFKADQIVKDVMTASQARIDQGTNSSASVSLIQESSIPGAQRKNRGEAGVLGGKVAHRNGKKIEIDENDLGQDSGPRSHEVSPPQSSSAIPASDGSVSRGQRPRGELEQQLWKRASFSERQTRAVYRQIGIDPEQEYKEEELEDHIILKAVRDYNHSKFAADEHIIIEGIIKDVFQGTVPDLDAPTQDYGNLQEAIHQSFELCKVDYTKTMKVKALQLFEILGSKHGCLLVGEPQSGKSTLIGLLESALNKAAMNEYTLAVQDRRKAAMLRLAKAHEKQAIAAEITKKANLDGGAGMSSDMIGGAVKKKSKKNDKDHQAKKLLGLYQDMYRKTKLSEEELQEIRENLGTKGVIMRRMNPKGMTQEEMFGTYDALSHEWREGLFSQEFRSFANMTDDKKKWILLDGPIDYSWVENLNSILDDNRKMSLPNGEQIKMSQGMCILLETDNMKNVTPATVSRCGLIYLHKGETSEPKAIFNQWLRNLPPNLQEYQTELENAANFLMVEAIAVFEEEKKASKLVFGDVDLHWLMQSFVRLLTTLVFDYFLEFEKSNAMNIAAQNPFELGKSLQNLTLGNAWTDTMVDPNATMLAAGSDVAGSHPASQASSRPASQARVETPSVQARAQGKRLPKCNFMDSELRYENALKFTPIWLEAFVIFSIVWTFSPIFSDSGKKQLDARLKAKYDIARTDFGLYQREKKRKIQEKNKEKSASLSKQFKASAAFAPRKSKQATAPKNLLKPPKEKDTTPNQHGMTPSWTDDLIEKPMLISGFPENASFYDYFFDLESSDWSKFNVDDAIRTAKHNYGDYLPSQRRIENLFVPSHDTVRYSYILECLVTKQSSTLVVGPACCGRSALLRQLLFEGVFDFTQQLITEHVTQSSHSDSKTFKNNIEALLEWRQSPLTGERRLRPPEGNKLICYVQDLHLSHTDQFGDQPAVEAIRDYLTAQAWLSSRKRRIRGIENLSFFACMASNAPEAGRVSKRALHKFNIIALDAVKVETMRSILQTSTDLVVGSSWPSAVHIYSERLVSALLDISQRVVSHLKPTPMKAHYTFNWRSMQKILFSIQMAEGNALKKQEDVMKLFYHECLRTYGDRLLMSQDQTWFSRSLEVVCRKHFDVLEGAAKREKATETELADHLTQTGKFVWPVKEPNSLYFSHWNQDVEGFYMEVGRIDDIQQVIEGALERFNDSNERVRLDLMLYSQLNRHMLRMLRVIAASHGHLINVAMKGYGIGSAVKLVAFAAGHQLRQLEIYEGFSDGEWKAELRRALIQCGSHDKPLTLYIDEDDMLKDQWYKDLECVLNNNMASEITRKSDIATVLATIYKEINKEKQGMRLGLSAEDLKKESLASYENKRHGEEETDEQKALFMQNATKMMKRCPDVQAELYKIFLNRVRTNFHLVLNYNQTEGNFREKISKHTRLMYLSQMLFFQDLPAAELEQLGKAYFETEHTKYKEKLLVEGVSIRELEEQAAKQDKDSQRQVLKSSVAMYLYAQEASKKYAEDEQQIVHFTPTHFLQIFKCYKRLLKERQLAMKEMSERYEAGLEKIRQTQDAIHSYHKELEAKAPALQNRMRQLFAIISNIEEEFTSVKKQRDQLKRDELEAEISTEQALRIKEDCEQTLNRVIPSLNQAMNSIESLSKADIAQLRAMNKPPKSVKIALQIVCLFLGIPPVEKKSKKTGKLKLSYWKTAISKDVLGNPRLPQLLIEFDRNKVTAEVMMKVEDVLLSPEYSYEKAYTASRAATGIFKWIKATRDYFYLFKEIEPRRDAFFLSQKQYLEKYNTLESKQTKIGELDTALVGLKEHQQSKDGIIAELRDEINDCSIRKKRADLLLRGLSAEKQKWVVCIRMLAQKYHSVAGDVLLTSGFITLLGGFPQKYRNRCLQKWAKQLHDNGFDSGDEFVFAELFGDSFKIRRWHQLGLPNDVMSINNALVISKTKRFCLLLDVQMQGILWLKAHCEEAGNLILLKQQNNKQEEGQFKKMIEIAIETGKTVIIEGVANHINLNLQSLMKRSVSKHGGQSLIRFCRKQYKYDKNFRLYVVSKHVKPCFSVNITNHVTMVNFNINSESLQAQLLSLVVMNERCDLENAYAENSMEAFDAIKSLKGVEEGLLRQLEVDVEDLLGEDHLIRTLNESKNTAEYVAQKLKNISVTNEFIEKARGAYAPVAFRATILFFIVQDLSKINYMYQFSLEWFKAIFKKSLELTNVVRPDPEKQSGRRGSEESGGVGQNEGSDLEKASKFSREDRIEFLIRTFTQELYKRISMVIFEEDKKLVTYLLVLKVMQEEACLEQSLLDFLIQGPDNSHFDVETAADESKPDIPWLSNTMISDLTQLAKVRPFNSKNLPEHIFRNSVAWTKFRSQRDTALCFKDLPNKTLIDLQCFLDKDGQNPKQHPHAKEDELKQDQLLNQGQSMERIERDTTNSDERDANKADMSKRLEADILNDPDIWNVSETEDDSASDEGNNAGQGKRAAGHEAKKTEQIAETKEQEMAKYLIQVAPAIASNTASDKTTFKQKLDLGRLHQKREKAIQGLCELCILRCIRPDQLSASMQRFVFNILDPNYWDFTADLLNVVLLERQRRLRDGSSAPISFEKERSLRNGSLRQSQNQAQTPQGSSGINQDANSRANGGTSGNADYAPRIQSSLSGADNASSQNTSQPSGASNNKESHEKKTKPGEEQEGETREHHQEAKAGELASIHNLLQEAYADSESRTPILLLVRDQGDAVESIAKFHVKSNPKGTKFERLVRCPLGQGLEGDAEHQLLRAAAQGDWLVLENLHLVDHWLPVLCNIILKLKHGPELNPRFRLWIACTHTTNFPVELVQKSIKIALEPTRTIKSQMKAMLAAAEKESFFRKAGKLVNVNSNLHKNLYFALIYFHSVVLGRGKYGPVGWNAPYDFDGSDFDVSNAQLLQLMRQSTHTDPASLAAALNMLQYFYANVNYAGKIQRSEDQVVLNAILGDLVNADVACAVALASDPDMSHLGIPGEHYSDYQQFCEESIPDIDPCEVFGFNWNMQSHQQAKEMFGLFHQMGELDLHSATNTKNKDYTNSSGLSVAASAARACLQAPSDASLEIQKMLQDQTSMLSLFAALQGLLSSSSLNPGITHGGVRYDHYSNQELLSLRDKNDKKVSELSAQLLQLIDKKFPYERILKQFPIQYKAPLNNIVHKEIHSYGSLLREIQDSVADLIATAGGEDTRPLQIEALWCDIQFNRIPKRWLKVSFATARTSLADFLIELARKLDFWSKIVEHESLLDVPSYWLPAFYSPKSFLNCFAQSRARNEEIPVDELFHQYEVQPFMTAPEACPQPNSIYIHGLWLEGADWDGDRETLVETTKRTRFIQFPVIKLTIPMAAELSAAERRHTAANFLDSSTGMNARIVKQPTFRSNSIRRRSPDGPDGGRSTVPEGASALRLTRPPAKREGGGYYKCPLYKSALRLAQQQGAAPERAAVEHIKLSSSERVTKWIKRGVALVLEAEYEYEK